MSTWPRRRRSGSRTSSLLMGPAYRTRWPTERSSAESDRMSPTLARGEVDAVMTFCTGSSCASGAEKRGDPRQGPRAAGGAGAPSSRTPPPPRFHEFRAAPAPLRTLPTAASATRRDDTGAWTREAPSRRRFGRAPWRTTAHLERVAGSTTRSTDFHERLPRGTSQLGGFPSLRRPAGSSRVPPVSPEPRNSHPSRVPR